MDATDEQLVRRAGPIAPDAELEAVGQMRRQRVPATLDRRPLRLFSTRTAFAGVRISGGRARRVRRDRRRRACRPDDRRVPGAVRGRRANGDRGHVRRRDPVGPGGPVRRAVRHPWIARLRAVLDGRRARGRRVLACVRVDGVRHTSGCGRDDVKLNPGLTTRQQVF